MEERARRPALGRYRRAHQLRDGYLQGAFGGKSALDRMLAGRVVDLADVRRYLDAERG
jgi:hypothetical protein